ncbi:MAG: hypothetical protein AB7F99_13830 [Vicinamibacterales bacterium]
MILPTATLRAACAACLLVLASACAARTPLIQLPAGQGEPAADGQQVVDEAAADCARVSSLIAESSVSGSVEGQRVRGTLHLGVASPASARIEAVAPFGRPLFTFVARDSSGTLLLTRPDRVVADASPAALLETVTGVPLDAPGLLAALAGCARQPEVRAARQIGKNWRVVPDGVAELYFNRSSASARWQLVAALHQDARSGPWRAEYHERGVEGVPRTLRLASRRDDGFDLRLALSQVEVNAPLDAAAFEIAVPAGAQKLTLEELREGAVLSDVVDDDGAGAP